MQRSLLLRRLPAWMRRTLAGRLLGLLLPTAALMAQAPATSASADSKTPGELRVFASAREAVPTVTERGAHHRVEQWVERIIGEDGTTNDVTHSYTVLANGMNYLDGGQWKETVAEFVPVQGGWLAGRGPHQVLVSDDLFVAGAVAVVSPEGAMWKSTPMTLALRDRAKGEVLVLGESRGARGEQVAANMILFRDAFDGPVPADVRVIYTAAGVECDVILRSRLPLSATLGADPAQCDLVVQTEVFEGGPTALRERQRTVNQPTDGQPDAAQKVPESRADAVLELGALRMEDGKAFGTEAAPAAESGQSVPVFKRYYHDEATQRLFLEESTPLDSLQGLLEPLPEASLPGAWEARWRNTALNERGTQKSGVAGALRSAPALTRRNNGRFEIAGADPQSTPTVSRGYPVASIASQPTGGSGTAPGVVLDWSYATSQTNFTFRSGTTYYVNSLVQLSGTSVVFEPNCVIKFAGDTTSGLQVNSGAAVTWLGEPYLPVTLTGKDDNTIGETIPGSSGSPGRYGGTYLFINGPAAPAMIRNARFRYARTAFAASSAYGDNRVTVRHAQFTDCDSVFRFQYGGSPNLTYFVENVLVVNAVTLFKDLYYAPVESLLITADIVGSFRQSVYNPDYSTVSVADSVLTAVGNVTGDNNCFISASSSGVFATMGAGSHYLAPASPVRDVWTTQGLGDGPLEQEPIELLTTQAPVPISSPWTSDAALRPFDWFNDPVNPDNRMRGYHYWKLDYLADNVTATAQLKLTNGVSVGLTGAKGFQLNAGGSISCGGSPSAPNRLVRVSLVQEGTAGVTGTFSVFGLGTGSPRPTIDARFTEFLLPTGPGRTFAYDIGNALASLILRDCRWAGGSIYLLPPATSVSQSVSLVNNIFEAADLGFHHYYDSNFAVTFRNNLVRKGQLVIYYASQPGSTQNPTWTLKDNLFERPSLQLTTVANGSYYVVAGYNGYATNTTNPFGGSGNISNLATDDPNFPTLGWQQGPRGRFYYPAKATTGYGLGRLVDAGSQSVVASGLAHFTTQTGATTREILDAPVLLDVGFHYPTIVRDYDRDTIPDIEEDADNDGVWDISSPPLSTDETNWQDADSETGNYYDTVYGIWRYSGDGLTDADERRFGSNPNSYDSDNDGRSDKVEWDEGTDPLVNTGPPALLQEWNFGVEGAGTFNSDGNLVATTVVSQTWATLFDGPAVKFTGSTTGVLKYPIANSFTPQHGAMRFTYVTEWYDGGPNDAPGIECRLFECGNLSSGQWSLSVSANGRALIFRVPKTGGGTRTAFITSLPRTDNQDGHRRGYDIELAWTRGGVWMRINGTAKVNENVAGAGIGEGGGVEAMPTDGTNPLYLTFGSDKDGGLRAQGWLDQVQTFNALTFGLVNPLWAQARDVEARRSQVMFATETANGLLLKWVRGWEGDPVMALDNYELERRTLPDGVWGGWSVNVFGNSHPDNTVQPGNYYEYRVNRTDKAPVTTIAAYKGRVYHGTALGPGRAILIVDTTISHQTTVNGVTHPSLDPQIKDLEKDLIKEGWEVLRWDDAPRNLDITGNDPAGCNDYWGTKQPVNVQNAAIVKNAIQTRLSATTTNVVFLIGHVAIPYAGTGNGIDGHDDHHGAWPTDAWYGDFAWAAGGGWTENTVAGISPNCVINNLVNDGRFAQTTLPLETGNEPGRLEASIGRIDFAKLPAFNAQFGTITEEDRERRLLKRYLAKAAGYRRQTLPMTVNDGYWAYTPWQSVIGNRRRLEARRWGTETLTTANLNNDIFLQNEVRLWGIHADYSHWQRVGNDCNPPCDPPGYHPFNEIVENGEIPQAMFLRLQGSYFGEWFHWDNDVTRVILGLENVALSVSYMSGAEPYHCDRLQVGGPLYSLVSDTFAASKDTPSRVTFLLGDPFLRQTYVPQVASLTAQTTGSVVQLNWPATTAATAGYRLYRGVSTTPAVWTFVKDVGASATSTTDDTPGSAQGYLIKALAVTSGGFGSFTNSSLGTVAPRQP